MNKVRRIETKSALIKDLSEGKIRINVTNNINRNDGSDTDR